MGALIAIQLLLSRHHCQTHGKSGAFVVFYLTYWLWFIAPRAHKSIRELFLTLAVYIRGAINTIKILNTSY